MSSAEFITDFELNLPYWRLPIFIVGIFKLGTSIIPLEELPITKLEYLIKLR